MKKVLTLLFTLFLLVIAVSSSAQKKPVNKPRQLKTEKPQTASTKSKHNKQKAKSLPEQGKKKEKPMANNDKKTNKSNSIVASHISISNSTRIESELHSWKVLSIDISVTNTIITKIVYPKSSPTGIWSTKDEFIEDSDTKQRYYINNSSIGFKNDNITNLYSQDARTFTETYPVLPSNVKRINISSGSQYYVMNLPIR